MIYLNIKSMGVECLGIVKIKFEKYTKKFYFESDEVCIKTAIANL